MLNIASPSVSMLLEIEKLVLDEISDFTPNQGSSWGDPAPEGHRDPIAKLLSTRSKRSNLSSLTLIKIANGESEGEQEDEEDDEDGDGHEDEINCKLYQDGGDNGLIRKSKAGSKQIVNKNKNNENLNHFLNHSNGDINGEQSNCELNLEEDENVLDDDNDDDGCLSPCCQDCLSGSPSPVHIISGLNNPSNNQRTIQSPGLNGFLTHEPPDGCEKINTIKDTKKSFRPNQLSHIVLAPCPQKPCNPGFVLLPSQSSAFLPLTKAAATIKDTAITTNLETITNRLNSTDLGTSINKLG